MTNYLKTAYDDLIVIIKAQYPRFIDPGRIAVEMLIGGEVQLEKSMLGYEDCIIIVPSDTQTEETSMILTSGGSLATYNMRLLYYKPKILENEFDSVTDFAESLGNYLKENYTHNSGKWIILDIGVNYDVPIPEGYEGQLYGFDISFTFTVGKY